LDTLVTLSPAWFEAKVADLDWPGNRLVDFDPRRARFIELPPGNHSVRLGCVIEPARVAAAPGFRVVSNAVKVVIEPPTGSRPVNWPASPELAKLVVVDVAGNYLKILNMTDDAAIAKLIDDMLARNRQVERQSAGTPLQAASQAVTRRLTALRRALRYDGTPAHELEEAKATSKAVVAMVKALAGVPVESVLIPTGNVRLHDREQTTSGPLVEVRDAATEAIRQIRLKTLARPQIKAR
jgi:hypothetical protein